VSWQQTEPYVPARHPAGVKPAAQTQAHYHSQSQGCVDCRAAAGPEESRQGYVVLTPRPQDAYRRAQAEHAARTYVSLCLCHWRIQALKPGAYPIPHPFSFPLSSSPFPLHVPYVLYHSSFPPGFFNVQFYTKCAVLNEYVQL